MRLVCWLIVILLCSSLAIAAADQYKPWLHKASIPEHPKIKLFGQYATNLFPGAGTYSFPIEVSKGTNGLQPSLSLTYNSQAVKSRPGVVGAGWALTQNYIYRDVNATPDNTTDDEFVLVLENTPYELIYNSNDGLFHTEVEYHFKVQNLTSGNNGYGRYWLVTLKNGIEYAFGNTTNSELGSNTGRSYAVRWNLDTVKDPFDNTINYTYLEDPSPEDNGTAYLDEITYNRDQQRKIKFDYENATRPDRRRVFEQGNRMEESRRLRHISMFVEDTLVRRYQLEYAPLNPALTAISSIKDFGADNSTLWYNITFTYYSSEAGYTNGSTWTPPALFSDNSQEDFGVRLVDVNNDGFMDAVRGRGSTSQKNVWINNKLSNWSADSSWVVPNYIVAGAGVDEGVRFADVNEDGLVDWIYAKDGVRNVSLHNGTAWIVNTNWSFPVDAVDASGTDQGILLEDLDGDGRTDIVRAKAGSSREVHLNTGAGWRNQTARWSFPVDVVTSTGADRGVRIVDVNADGLPDVVLAGQDGGNARNAWLNNGSGWVNSSVWVPPANFTTTSNTDNGVRFADLNSDGLIDMVEDFANSSSTSRNAWLNNGSGWVANDTWQAPEAFTSAGFNIGRRLADVNGDGFADLIVSHQDSTQQYTWRKNIATPYFLLRIRNEYGGTTVLNYTSSTRYNNTDEDGLSDMGFGVYVVMNMSTSNGITGAFAVDSFTSYNYSYGKYNYPNAEFRGFGITVEGKPAAMVTHYFYQDDPRRGKEYRQVIADRSGLNYSKAEQDFNYTFGSNIYNVSLRSATSYLYDGVEIPKVTNISYTYDVYDNPLLIREVGDANSTGDERTWNYSYAIDTTDWFLDRRARETLLDDQNNTVKETRYYYDEQGFEGIADKGALTKIERWHAEGNHSFTSFEYDQWGNVVRQTDSLGNSISYSFDATHTYPAASVNALGQVTHFKYDPGTGNLRWSEKNGIRTAFEYDTLGRVLKEIQPLDTTFLPTKRYNYSFDGVAPEMETISLKTTANKTEKASYYYDGLAQVVQFKTTIEDNRQIAKNIFYDSSGRVKAEQNPYFTSYDSAISGISATDVYTNYTYDAMDRVIQVRNTDGTVKNITFNQWNITDIDENGHRHQYLLDSRGQIVAVLEFVQDPILGTNETFYTAYDYDDNGNLIQITDNEMNVFEFTYDSLSRKTAMNDPDLGIWRYYYDTNGNIMLQNDSRGQTIRLGYDALNRVINKNSTDNNFTFTYDVEYDGTLYSIQSNTSNITYHYDERLRVINETTRTEGVNFEKLYAYDSQNRLISKDGLGEIDFIYNFQGKVQKIPSYVNNSAYNAFSSLLNRTYGNGLVQTFSYNSQTNRLSSINIPNVQNLSYTYDNVGNILTINDQINSRFHRLGYDDVNRLLSANISGERYVYSYNSLGNIMKAVKNNQTIKFVYNNITHAPSEILNGSAGADIHAPKEFNSTNKTRNFEFYILNDKNTTLTDVNVTVRFGDGQTYTNNSLTITESQRMVVSHNYTNAGLYSVNISVTAPNSSDSQIITSKFGIRARNLTRFYHNNSLNFLEFKVQNDLLASSAASASWNCSGGITSLYTINLTSNQTVFDYLAYNFTSAGEKTYACTATSQDGNDTATLSFTVKGLDVENYDILYKNISNHILSYGVRNYFTQGITNISMDAGSGGFSRNVSINNNERVWVFAQTNYTSDNRKDFTILLQGRNETEAYREELNLKGSAIENYQRIESNTTKRILLFDIRNKWQEGNVSWNISEPSLGRNNYLAHNQTLMVFIEQNYTGQGDKEPVVQAKASSYVEQVKDFFEIRPIRITSLSTLADGASAVSELIVQNTLNQTQTFSWQFDSGKENLSSSAPATFNTSTLFVYIASNHTNTSVWRTFARINTSVSNDTARGVIVS